MKNYMVDKMKSKIVIGLAFFFVGYGLSWLVSYKKYSDEWFYDEIFYTSSEQIKIMKVAEYYFQLKDDKFTDYLLCELLYYEESMRLLVEKMSDRSLEVNRVYGGVATTQLSSDHIFLKAGLTKENFDEKRCDNFEI